MERYDLGIHVGNRIVMLKTVYLPVVPKGWSNMGVVGDIKAHKLAEGKIITVKRIEYHGSYVVIDATELPRNHTIRASVALLNQYLNRGDIKVETDA